MGKTVSTSQCELGISAIILRKFPLLGLSSPLLSLSEDVMYITLFPPFRKP
jgi:hypothetical protein